VITARHFANRAPSSRYSTNRARRPSSPSVTSSSGDFASFVVPLSTLMPGMIPCASRISGNARPSDADWRIVSSKRITPLT